MKRMTTIGLLMVALGAEAQDQPSAEAQDQPSAEAQDQPPAEAAPKPPAEDTPAPAGKPAAPKKADDLASQLRLWSVLSGTAPQIDACTARYTTDFPDRKGDATIIVNVLEGGRVQDANATTGLPSSDRLITCLSAIGRLWRFSDGPFELSLPVPVAKGQKLRLKKPGEKDEPSPPKDAPKEEQREGYIRFTPSWTQTD